MAESTGTMEGQAPSTSDQSSAGKQLRDQTAAVKEDLSKLAQLTRDASQEKLAKAKEAASEYLEKGKQKVGEVEDSMVRYVREKPIKSVLLAAGAGALLGFLLSRR
jgi:ElaB/YqjD/DUF883 family membrane-anchored ribosome-binding protein